MTVSPAPAASAHWIQRAETFNDWLTQIPADAIVGVDTEFMRRDTFYPQLALLQLGWQGNYALVDPLAFDLGPALHALCASAGPTLVLHSAGEDLEALAPYLPEGPSKLFDTQIAAALCGIGLGLSYRDLVTRYHGVSLDKGETRSNWLQRPLTSSQRDYATLDVVYLEAIHSHLQQRLHELERNSWLAEECTRLKARARRRIQDDQPQRNFRPATDWPHDEQAKLRRLLLWRDHTARQLDRPRGWLLEDTLILSLIQQPPSSTEELKRRSHDQRALRQAQRDALYELLQSPIAEADLDATQPIPAPLQERHKRNLQAMKAVIEQQAKILGLPPGLLCSRRILEEFLLSRHWPTQLEGWRKPLLHHLLAPLLPE